jgi:hypothetical protein
MMDTLRPTNVIEPVSLPMLARVLGPIELLLVK